MEQPENRRPESARDDLVNSARDAIGELPHGIHPVKETANELSSLATEFRLTSPASTKRSFPSMARLWLD